MKGKNFYIALIGLIIIGIGSVVIYRQQQGTRALDFEGYEITLIENRVDALFNDDKTDIQENISVELVNLEQIFLELNEKDLSNQTKRGIENIETEFITAKEMYDLQRDISNVFREKDIIGKNVSVDEVEELQSNLLFFEDKTIYYSRNNDLLTDARVQIKTIEEATKLVGQLLIDGVPNENIDEEEMEKLEELVNQIKDETIKELLLERIGTVRLVLKEAEEELALDDVEDLEDLEEEPEDTLEEEDLDTGQSTDGNTEQTDTSTSQSNNQTNNQTNNNQSQTSNNNKTPSSQTENQSNSNSSNQSNNQSSTVEQKPAVAEQYQETKIIKEIPYKTLVYENNNITAGEEIVYVEGSQGTVTETYEVTIYKNGTSNRKLISRNETDPVDRVVTIGTKEPKVIEE